MTTRSVTITHRIDANVFKPSSVHRMTWNDESIPEEEEWLKLEGDKRGGTFKLAFQH